MRSHFSRRHLLRDMAAGLSAVALPRFAQAQGVTQPALTPGPPGRPGRHRVDEPAAVEVNARPLPSFDIRDRARVRFGSLEYRSGLILTSPFAGFGGLSALRLDAKGERFIAVSDQGTWFTGRIVYRGRDMAGLDDVEAAPLLDAQGKPITATRGWYDSESLALDGSIAYVGLERVNQVLRYDFAKGFTRARGEVVSLPPAARRLPINKGLEALVFVPKVMPKATSPSPLLAGTLIALSERGLDAAGNLIAFLIGGKTPGQFSVRRTENYDISDAVLLPSGDLLILERKFSWLGGAGIRIRRLALSDIAPGAVVDGPAIFNADLGNEIDNMEGIDAHVTDEGETVLTMISDDNFSLIQRNLLLQFTLVG